MRIAMLCHAGHATGTGHLVRCVALAEAASRRGHDPVIVGQLEPSSLVTSLLKTVTEVVRLGSRDPQEAAAAVTATRPDLVHMDAYETGLDLAGDWLLSNMRDGSYGDRPADLVVDPTLGATPPSSVGTPGVVELVGASFAPLRSDIADRHGAWASSGGSRVLITMGSTDPRDLTSVVERALRRADPTLDLTVLSSRAMPANELGSRTRVLATTPEFGELVLEHDLVVSAAGTTVSELACLGVPTALVCAVPNQRPSYDHVVGVGAAWGLGETPQEVSTEVGTVREQWGDPLQRQARSRAALALVDGLGSARIVRAWEDLSARRGAGAVEGWRIRPAELSDAADLLSWRNDRDARRASRSSEVIDPREHQRWLRDSLARPDRLVLVAERNGNPLGTVRWSRHGDGTWEVSIALAPEARGGGAAADVLRLGEASLVRAAGAPVSVRADVHSDNERSARLFTRAGYVLVRPADDVGFLSYEKVLAG